MVLLFNSIFGKNFLFISTGLVVCMHTFVLQKKKKKNCFITSIENWAVGGMGCPSRRFMAGKKQKTCGA